jgi:hypothetical protein
MIAKLIIHKTYTGMRQILSKKLKYACLHFYFYYTNRNIEIRGKDLSNFYSFNILRKIPVKSFVGHPLLCISPLIKLYTKSIKKKINLRLFNSVSNNPEIMTYTYFDLLKQINNVLYNIKYLLSGHYFIFSRSTINRKITNSSTYFKKSSLPLQFFSLGKNKLNRTKTQLLTSNSFLGSYSLTSLKNQTQINLSLRNSYNYYSTKTPKISSANSRPITNRLYSPKINYIKGWKSNWLRKLRYIEMLDNYKLDTNDKLFIRIIKERNYNITKKLSQVEEPRSIELVGDKPKIFYLNDSESLINNTNLSLIKNKKNKNTNSNLFAVDKSNNLLNNQFIQYKFNRSNAKANNFNMS